MIDTFATAAGSNLTTIAAVVLAFLAGATAPTYYAQERLRGFGRALASRLPYRPPPGVEESEAMVEAADDTADDPADDPADG